VGDTGESGADLAFTPDRRLGEGDVVAGPGWHLQALHTPGHASNHLCFALAEEEALFSGDQVMGWSTTVIAPPDGDMAAYMRSLERLRQRPDRTYWPTHGGPIHAPAAHIEALIQHRLARRQAVLRSLGERPARPQALVDVVYPGLDPALHDAAAQSLLAHLIELAGDGLAREANGAWTRGGSG
jgi:glyoxylase-like metal-dependent hydrolase (beta-lactamase superfamily II)